VPKKITLILFTLFLLSYGSVAFQTPPPKLDSLKVELWPEYDRPETLVIYKGKLAPATALPTEITFILPGYVEAVHAVAVEQNGNLLQVPPAEVKLTRGDQHGVLTFPISSDNFQFEYYDPTILTKQGQNRQLAYRFSASFDITAIAIEVQQPAQSLNFTLNPTATQTVDDVNGLTYHLVEVANLQLGSGFNLNVTYSRPTNATSVELLKLPASTPPPSAATPPANDNTSLAYILFGVGSVILLVIMAYFWSNRRRPVTKGRLKHPPIISTAEAKFCHHCGTALREGATFCHSCGTARRS